MPKDAADLHVERWRDHWALEENFDDGVEAMTVRMNAIVAYFRATTKAALARLDLQDFEYNTLHALMIRDTPGKASPGALAHDLGVSNAGMSGRLDGLERRGWLQRLPGAVDRRTVDVEITRAGVQIWREAMRLRGTAEDDVAAVLSPADLATLNRLLKQMTLHIEKPPEEHP